MCSEASALVRSAGTQSEGSFSVVLPPSSGEVAPSIWGWFEDVFESVMSPPYPSHHGPCAGDRGGHRGGAPQSVHQQQPSEEPLVALVEPAVQRCRQGGGQPHGDQRAGDGDHQRRGGERL